MTQLKLSLPKKKGEPPKLDPAGSEPRLIDKVRHVMSCGKWMTAFAVERRVREVFGGKRCSDSSITARIRELRRMGFDVPSKRIKGADHSVYRIAGEPES